VPELPDVTIYVERLAARLVGSPVERIRLVSPFLVRSVEPPLRAAEGKRLVGVRRLGKRIIWALEDDIFFVFHLMIAGRFHWKGEGAKIPAKVGLAAFDFPAATVLLTEASSKKRATQSMLVLRWTDRDDDGPKTGEQAFSG
jgi:formamidopyrimidine-DNA glycosylase